MSEIKRSHLFGKLNPVAYRAIEAATVFCKMRGNPYVELVHWIHQILQLQDTDLHHVICQFNIDPASGELTPKSPAVVHVPGVRFPGIAHLAVIPGGSYLYATSDQPPNLFAFRADARGRLHPAQPAKIRVGGATTVMAFLPDVPRARFSVRVAARSATLNAGASTDPGDRIVRYVWSFGDGTRLTTSKPVVAHRYRRSGRYRVTLSVTSSTGCAAGGFIYTGTTTTCNGRLARNALSFRVA